MSDSESDSEREEEEEALDLSVDTVVTKYKAAAEIVQRTLAEVVQMCKPGASVVEICSAGDKLITDATGKLFNKKTDKGEKVEKGIAFPTCVSSGTAVCHLSPLAEDDVQLKDGELARIDLGCHIDGFIAVAAHTVMVQAEDKEITGRAADVLAATRAGAECAMRLMRPGKTSLDVADALERVAEAYECNVVEGVLSHQMKRFVIDGNNVVLNKGSPDYRAEEFEFKENEVYAVDVVMSTGEGKPQMKDEKQTSVYKRALDRNYQLKMKASRSLFSEISIKFPALPFTLRALDEPRKKLGIVELVNHDLVQPYPVLHEKEGECVAHLKFTLLLMPNGTDKATGLDLQPHLSEKAIEDEEIKALLATSLKTKKKKNKKKKKDGEGDAMES